MTAVVVLWSILPLRTIVPVGLTVVTFQGYQDQTPGIPRLSSILVLLPVSGKYSSMLLVRQIQGLRMLILRLIPILSILAISATMTFNQRML